MAQLTFNQLPAASALTGTEVVPVMQGGTTARTTTAALAASTGRWVDALAAGAVGDGTTDDTAALQAILDDHRLAYLRPGHTFATGTLTLTSGSGFVGENPGGYVQGGQTEPPDTAVSKLLLLPGTNAPMLSMPEDTSHVVIRDVEIDGNDFYQDTPLNLIDLPAVTGDAREARLIIEDAWVHNSEGRCLFVGAGRLGVILSRAILTNAKQEIVAIWGNDTRISSSLIGIGPADALKIAGDVYSVTDTEVFAASTGLVIDARRGSIHGCTIDRNGGRGAYIAPGATDATFTACIFHSNSLIADGVESHVDVRDGASARFIACHWAANDTPIPNNAEWCVTLDPAAIGATFVACNRDPGASLASTTTLADPEGLTNQANDPTKVTTVGTPRWPAGTAQTGVGPTGTADAPPDNPATWLRVVAPDGTRYLVPAYHPPPEG